MIRNWLHPLYCNQKLRCAHDRHHSEPSYYLNSSFSPLFAFIEKCDCNTRNIYFCNCHFVLLNFAVGAWTLSGEPWVLFATRWEMRWYEGWVRAKMRDDDLVLVLVRGSGFLGGGAFTLNPRPIPCASLILLIYALQIRFFSSHFPLLVNIRRHWTADPRQRTHHPANRARQHHLKIWSKEAHKRKGWAKSFAFHFVWLTVFFLYFSWCEWEWV